MKVTCRSFRQEKRAWCSLARFGTGKAKSCFGEALMAVVAVVAGMASADDTWYLNSNNGGYKPVTDGSYWTSVTTGEKGTTINATDTYVVKNGYTYKTSSDYTFAGKVLVIGDLEEEKYTSCLYFNGHVRGPTEKIVFARGYATHGTKSTSNYQLNPQIEVTAPKATPFGLTSSVANTVNIKTLGGLSGDSSVGLIIGGYYNGTAISRTSVTNVTFTLGSLENYHGALTCVSAREALRYNVGNILVNVDPSPNFGGTLEIENGVKFVLASAGELCADELKLHDGAMLKIYSSGTTTGVIRVASKFEIPEKDGKVRVSLGTSISTTSADPRDFPLLIVPDTQTLDADSFEMCGVAEPLWATGKLLVTTDAAAHTKSLVWRVWGSRKLATSDSIVYASSAAMRSTFTSALSEGNESQWDPEELPQAGSVYELGQSSGYGLGLRTPYDLTEDYVFPGESIKLIGDQAYLVLANEYGFEANIYASAGKLQLRAYNNMDPELKGRLHLDVPACSVVYASSVLTVESKISGSGNWDVSGYESTGSPNGTTWFTGDNSEWTGTISVKSNKSDKGGPSESYHQTVGFASTASFGGGLDEMNYKALQLWNYTAFKVTNDVEMAANQNRGICIRTNAIFEVASGSTLTCNWPLTLGGRIIKKVDGTLVLGGALKFIDADGAVTDTLPADVALRTLDFRAGTVKVSSTNSVDGLYMKGTIKLALDFNPADADLKRYGFYNVKTETPFEVGNAISFALQNVDSAVLAAARQTEAGYKQGLVTVRTAAAGNVEDNLSVTKVKGLKVIREDDLETGFTTFSLYGKRKGLAIIFY